MSFRSLSVTAVCLSLARLAFAQSVPKPGDTAYLQHIDSLAPGLVGSDSLPRMLEPYHDLAFSRENLGKYRMHYFKYLAVQALSKGRNGSAVYYAQKENEEGIRNGTLKREDIPRSEYFAMSVDCYDKDFARALIKYGKLRPAVERLFRVDSPSQENLYIAFSVLEQAAFAGTQADSPHIVDEVEALAGNLLKKASGIGDKYKAYMPFYNSTYHIILYSKENKARHTDTAGRLLEQALSEASAPDFPPSLRPYCLFDLYNDAFDYYYRRKDYDSARHYLEKVRTLPSGLMDHTDIKTSLLMDGQSKLAASEGDYPQAYLNLRRAYEIRDSAYYAVSSDRDNNLYALAEVDDARTRLLSMDEKNARTRQFNLVLFGVLAGCFAIGGFYLVGYRSRSRRRLLNLQLGLARNFHDEIGPMILYTNTLVKKELSKHASSGLEEIKAQLGYIMQAVRGISHDLKSGEIATVASFAEEAVRLLEKIKDATGIDFTLRRTGGDETVSHFQLMHLRKILNELMGNSIKHSGCRQIQVALTVGEGQLNLQYSDDGQGIKPGADDSGIGLKNIEERVDLLRGRFDLDNAYPEGYEISVRIPLI